MLIKSCKAWATSDWLMWRTADRKLRLRPRHRTGALTLWNDTDINRFRIGNQQVKDAEQVIDHSKGIRNDGKFVQIMATSDLSGHRGLSGMLDFANFDQQLLGKIMEQHGLFTSVRTINGELRKLVLSNAFALSQVEDDVFRNGRERMVDSPSVRKC